jgi:hypothetical protein
MKRLTIGVARICLVAPLLMLAGVSHIQAATILINFEQFSDGYNLQGINLGGVTLSNPSGKVEIYDDRFGVSSHSGTKAIASLAGVYTVNPLVGVFDQAVSSVSLWGGDEGWSATEMDSWELLAYDARIGGNLVGRVNSGSWRGSPYRQLSISAPSILRFQANWTGSQFGIGYDDLMFVTVPPPSPPPPQPKPEPEPEPKPEPEPEPKPEPEPEPQPESPLPSNGSFDGTVDQDVLAISFGQLHVGDTSSVPFYLWNLPSAGLTANLNLVGVWGSGDTGVLTTSLAQFTGLEAKAFRTFLATIDTSRLGEFSATYWLPISDDTLQRQYLRIVLTGLIVPEPSTVVLAALGLVSLLGWGWWRRKAR